MMKGKMILFAGMMVLALGLVGTPASWANSLSFQNVTFDLNVINAGATLEFKVTVGAGGPTGDWTGANGFAAFEIKNIGTVTGLGLSGWSVTDNSLSANGCVNGNTSGGCFVRNSTSPVAITGGTVLTFNISKTTGTFDLTLPHLKVLFTTGGSIQINSECSPNQIGDCVSGKTGTLLSRDVTNGGGVPEPASLLLLGAGLAGVGIWRRKAATV